MLQHQPEEPTVPTAADARVTPEELRVDATPAQMWEYVQKERAASVQSVAVQSGKPLRRWHWLLAAEIVWVLLMIAYRLLLHVPSGTASLPQSAAAPVHSTVSKPTNTSGLETTISGNGGSQSLLVAHADVTITGNGNQVVLRGRARFVTVSGHGNDVEMQGQAQMMTVHGNGNMLRGTQPKTFTIPGVGNDVQWTDAK